MAVSTWWDRLAAAAPVPVHVVRGLGGSPDLARLRAHPHLRVVASPRHATVLVVVGSVPHAHLDALAAVHDQVPAPRAVAALGLEGDLADLGLGDVHHLPVADPVGALRDLQADVLAGRVDHAAAGRATHPVDWQGVGPHGQGGEGMMGGTPYGRMLPMPPVEGRDGLALDRLSLRLGPFLPGLPAGLVLDVGLQGDVLEAVALHPADPAGGVVGRPVGGPAPDGHAGAVALLAALAELCAVAGLPALARRTARTGLDPDPTRLTALRRRLDRRWGLRAATDGVGVLPDGSDATDRWRGWLDRAAVLVEGATPEPAPSRAAATIGEALVGQELGRAWLALCSLQPDLDPGLPVSTPMGAA